MTGNRTRKGNFVSDNDSCRCQAAKRITNIRDCSDDAKFETARFRQVQLSDQVCDHQVSLRDALHDMSVLATLRRGQILYELEKPKTRIGRASSNDIALESQVGFCLFLVHLSPSSFKPGLTFSTTHRVCRRCTARSSSILRPVWRCCAICSRGMEPS